MAIHHTDLEKLVKLGAAVGVNAKELHETDIEELIKLTTQERQLTIYNADHHHESDLEKWAKTGGKRVVLVMTF